jgi:hypothetical protein
MAATIIQVCHACRRLACSRRRLARFLLFGMIGLVLVQGDQRAVNADELLPVSDRAALPVPHFPDAAHVVVWRNWQLVEPERLAAVLGTNVETLTKLATSMGLPPKVQVPPEMHQRGYITIIRRNWHLLPYDQLLQILGMTKSELAFRLREDDFLYGKLGFSKPRCEPVKYREPDASAQHRAKEI